MPSVEIFSNDPSLQPVRAGQALFQQGDTGEVMYVVTEGEIELIVRGKIVDVIKPGGLFGEMALVDRRARSASAVAKTDAKVVPIDQKRFLYLIQNTPSFAVEVMHVMSDRIRRISASH